MGLRVWILRQLLVSHALPWRLLVLISTVLACSRVSLAVEFTNVTQTSGVDYLQYDLRPPFLTLGQPYMSGGAASGDYDGDGWVDLYVTRLDNPDILFRNKGDGTFEDVTVSAGLTLDLPSNGAAWGDVDNDGDLDLYVTTIQHNRFYLYINDNGQFSEEAVVRGAQVPSTSTHNGFSVTLGDYNRDGWLDIHTTEWGFVRRAGTNHARLLKNEGAAAPGTFTDVTLAAGVDVENASTQFTGYNAVFSFASRFSDLDDDGWPDLVIVGDFGSSQLFWNNHDGTFTDGTTAAGVGTDENGMGSAIGDYDGDGRLDWFVTSIYDENATCDNGRCNWGYTGNRLFRNEGDRVFSDQTDTAGVRDGQWGWGTAFFDYDNDGDQDLVMTNGTDLPHNRSETELYATDTMRFWRNDDGVFKEISTSVGVDDTGSGKGLLTFDYDKDGDLDIFVVNNAGHPVLYRNEGGNDNDWLRVDPVGRTSNRDGLGAVITVTPTRGGPSMKREMNAGSHYLGQSEFTAHFGLGEREEPIDILTIRWPSGETQELLNIAPNQTLLVTESVAGDCNGDNNVNVKDANCTPQASLAGFLSANGLILGDADGDGEVQFSDFVVLSGKFGYRGQYTEGDLNKDGRVQFEDFVTLSTHYGQSATALVVPEPNSWTLALLAFASHYRRPRTSCVLSRPGNVG